MGNGLHGFSKTKVVPERRPSNNYFTSSIHLRRIKNTDIALALVSQIKQ